MTGGVSKPTRRRNMPGAWALLRQLISKDICCAHTLLDGSVHPLVPDAIWAVVMQVEAGQLWWSGEHNELMFRKLQVPQQQAFPVPLPCVRHSTKAAIHVMTAAVNQEEVNVKTRSKPLARQTCLGRSAIETLHMTWKQESFL